MKHIRIFGIGSPFGCDQLGWYAVDLLLQQENIKTYIQQGLIIEKLDRPGIQLLEHMKDAQTVYLIDAIKIGTAAGAIHRLENQQIEKVNSPLSSHNLKIGETVHLGRVLNNLPANIILYGIEIEDEQETMGDFTLALRKLIILLENELHK